MKKFIAIIAMLAVATLASCSENPEVDVENTDGTATEVEYNEDGSTTITIDDTVEEVNVDGEEVLDTETETIETEIDTIEVDADAATESNTDVDATNVNSTVVD